MNATYSSITIGIHQFAQWSVFLDFELNDSIILAQDLQIYVLGFSLQKKKKSMANRLEKKQLHRYISFLRFPALFHQQAGILKMAPIFPVNTNVLRGKQFIFSTFCKKKNMFHSIACLNWQLRDSVCVRVGVYLQMHMY